MKPLREVSEQLREIYANALQDAHRNRYDSELWRYYGHLGTEHGSLTRVRFMQDLCQLARFDPDGKTILDAGCGFGALSIILWLMGAKEVHGIEVYEPRLTTFRKMIEDFQLNSVYAEFASVENMPYADRYFDLVLSNEAISHYYDVEAFLRESARVLKPGGILLIADGNNGANPHIRKHTYNLWERFEQGPPGTYEGHRVKSPYIQMRAEIVRAAAPQLEEAMVEQIAKGTSGMNREEILRQVERYLATGELPTSYYEHGTVPRNPLTGAVAERLFHPAELAAHIERFGFRARYYAYFGGASGNPAVRLINRVGAALSPLTLQWARGFRIVAQRT